MTGVATVDLFVTLPLVGVGDFHINKAKSKKPTSQVFAPVTSCISITVRRTIEVDWVRQLERGLILPRVAQRL